MPRTGGSHPWICPIRGCERDFEVPWALGGHFSVSILYHAIIRAADLCDRLVIEAVF